MVNGRIGGWIRPINIDNGHAVSEADSQFENGTSADVLDIVAVPLLGARPSGHQTENHVIASDYYWEKRGRANWQQIVDATDVVHGPLWVNADSSYHGVNDKVPEAIANQLTSSLCLVEPTNLNLIVGRESQYGGGSKRKVRASFTLNGMHYNFVVTDLGLNPRILPVLTAGTPFANRVFASAWLRRSMASRSSSWQQSSPRKGRP